jgi:N-acetylmuramoyl-L-alanine amidase
MFKYKIVLILILLCTIGSFSFVKANKLPLMGKVIYLDPGHGGYDPGALAKNMKEADINLKICLKLKEILVSKGASVYLTRTADYDLSLPNASNHKRSDLNRRIKLINDSKANLYLSIHLNSETNESWHGAQVFYDDVNEQNKELASLIQKNFNKDLSSVRKIKEIKNLYLYRHLAVPGALVEVGFISNNNERYLLKTDDYQEKIATSILKSVIQFLK